MTTNESDMIRMVMWELKRYSEAPRPTLKRSLKIWALEDSETFSNNSLDPALRRGSSDPTDSDSTLAVEMKGP